jgi:hypothetical protein
VPTTVQNAAETLAQAPAPAPAVETLPKPETLPQKVVERASAPLADTPASSLQQQLSPPTPRTVAATGRAATHVFRAKSPQTASAPAATPRRAGAPLPRRTAPKPQATRAGVQTRIANVRTPATAPDTRVHIAIPSPSLPEPVTGETGGLAAAASGGGSGAVAALLAVTILAGLLQVGARRMPASVRPLGVLSVLLLERPG